MATPLRLAASKTYTTSWGITTGPPRASQEPQKGGPVRLPCKSVRAADVPVG